MKINGKDPEPDDSLDLLTEWMINNTYFTVRQCERVARFLVDVAAGSDD